MPQLIKKPQNEGVGKQPISGKVFLFMTVFPIKRVLLQIRFIYALVVLWQKIMDRLRLKLQAQTEKQCHI